MKNIWKHFVGIINSSILKYLFYEKYMKTLCRYYQLIHIEISLLCKIYENILVDMKNICSWTSVILLYKIQTFTRLKRFVKLVLYNLFVIQIFLPPPPPPPHPLRDFKQPLPILPPKPPPPTTQKTKTKENVFWHLTPDTWLWWLHMFWEIPVFLGVRFHRSLKAASSLSLHSPGQVFVFRFFLLQNLQHMFAIAVSTAPFH